MPKKNSTSGSLTKIPASPSSRQSRKPAPTRRETGGRSPDGASSTAPSTEKKAKSSAKPVLPIIRPNAPAFSDRDTTVESLKDLVRGFISEREWTSYHTPKNVAASVAIEAAELLEHFQWEHPTPAELSKTKRGEIADEMADVLAYLLSLANVLKIDLAAALQKKMCKNRKKYPADRFRGKWEKVRS